MTDSDWSSPDKPMLQMVVALPATLTLDAECLGTVWTTELDSLGVEIVLPTAQGHHGGRRDVGPPPIPGIWEWGIVSELLTDDVPWGSVVSRRDDTPLGKGDVVNIYHVLLRFQVDAGIDEEAAQEITDRLMPTLKTWMNLLADWIEVLQQTYLKRSEFPVEAMFPTGSKLLVLYVDGRPRRRLSRDSPIGARVGIAHKEMSLAKWHLAVRLAEASREPPTEYAFLRDARGSLRSGSGRRAVLDAATAAEISVAKLLDAQTASAGEPIRKAIRDANNNLGRATRTLRQTFGMTLRKDIQSGLAEPRNDAIHAGVEPSRDVAKLAIEIAAELVERATPYAELVRLDP